MIADRLLYKGFSSEKSFMTQKIRNGFKTVKFQFWYFIRELSQKEIEEVKKNEGVEILTSDFIEFEAPLSSATVIQTMEVYDPS